MTRKECLSLLANRVSEITGFSRSECYSFASRMIEPPSTSEYYQSCADSIESNLNYYIAKFYEN